MTISSPTNRFPYAGNGVTTNFAYPTRFLSEEDLVVILRSAAGVESTKVLNVDYTVAGAGEADGGSITMSVAPAANEVLTIYGDPAVLQGFDLEENDKSPAEQHERAFDLLTLICQRLKDLLTRSVRLSEGYADTFNTTLPSVLEAGRTIVINEDEDGFTAGPLVGEIEEAAANAAAAASSAAAAASSATNAAGSETNAAASAAAAASSASAAASSALTAGNAQTAAEAAQAAAEAAKGAAETAVTNAGTAQTAAEAAQTAAETAASNASDSASAAAASQTAAALAKTGAEAAQAAAENAVASIMWNDVVFATEADSPIEITQADNGKLYVIDATDGPVTVNLPEISGLDLGAPFAVGFKKSDDSGNAITLTAAGSEEIDGEVTKLLEDQGAGATLIPDTDPNPDAWTSVGSGAGGSGVPTVIGTRSSPQAITTAGISHVSKPAQDIHVQGDGGPVVVSADPQIAAGSKDGQRLTLIGRSDANTVTLVNGNGLRLRGPMELGEDSSLGLRWDGVNWVEISRV